MFVQVGGGLSDRGPAIPDVFDSEKSRLAALAGLCARDASRNDPERAQRSPRETPVRRHTGPRDAPSRAQRGAREAEGAILGKPWGAGDLWFARIFDHA